MSSKTTSWILELVDRVTAPLQNVQGAADDAAGSADRLGSELDEAASSGDRFNQIATEFGAKAFLFNQAADGISRFNSFFQNAIAPGVRLETQMANLSAMTGKKGEELQALERQARSLGREFGVGAPAMVESFMDVIMRLGGSFAGSNEAMEIMGRNVGYMSKMMGGDATSAANAISAAMLQYGVDLSNPIEAAQEATRMMNIMKAAANEGGSQVIDTAQALQQAGLLAKQSGLSFEELNAALQGLGRGQIESRQAGTAMRMILLNMSTLSNSSKQVIDALQAYGVNVDLVSDPTVRFTDRLRELQKIQHDTGLMQTVFNSAYMAAGNTMLNNIDNIDKWTESIVGTNAAVDGANIIMGTYEELMNRVRAAIDNVQSTMFKAIRPIAPFISLTGDAVSSITNMGVAVWGLSVLFKKDLYVGIWAGIKALGVWVKTSAVAKVAIGALAATKWLLSAAFITSPIGWIVLGVGALAAAVVYCWNKFEGFRAVVMGVWEVMKGFGNMLKEFVLDRIKGLLNGIGALGRAIGKLFQRDWSGAWDSAKEGVRGIFGIDAYKNAFENGRRLGEAYAEGAEKGRESFRRSKENEAETPQYSLTRQSGIGAKSVIGSRTIPQVKPLNQSTAGDNSRSTISGTGGSGGGKRAITMNVTVNMTNNGVNDPEQLANQVVRYVNDRLNDTLAQAG